MNDQRFQTAKATHCPSQLPDLPKGILKTDLKYPKWNAKNKANRQAVNGYRSMNFEIWYTTGFGWCIPTLTIRNARGPSDTRRTYATRIDTGGIVRIGRGPHVTAVHTVYVKVGRLEKLQKFIDMQYEGQAKSGEIRDDISTRRLRRSNRSGNHFIFGW